MQERSIAIGDFQGNLSIIDLETSQDTFNVKAHE